VFALHSKNVLQEFVGFVKSSTSEARGGTMCLNREQKARQDLSLEQKNHLFQKACSVALPPVEASFKYILCAVPIVKVIKVS
jgi:hypothetical protein